MKNNLGSLFIQIIPVMIGVYLGFVISDWSKSRETESKKQLLIENIAVELQNNKKKIEEVVGYHKMLRDSARFYSSSKAIPSSATFFRGVNTITLTSSAFETGVQTGLINELEIDQIQRLNDTYPISKFTMNLDDWFFQD